MPQNDAVMDKPKAVARYTSEQISKVKLLIPYSYGTPMTDEELAKMSHRRNIRKTDGEGAEDETESRETESEDKQTRESSSEENIFA